MKKIGDIFDEILEFSGCGCFIIVVAAIAFAIISGIKSGKATRTLKHLRDSVENVQKLDSIKQVEHALDLTTAVICFEGDSLYHYYINCDYIYLIHGTRIISRNKAKKMGMKACPDCLDVEFYYMGEKGYSEDSEKGIKAMKSIYSNKPTH